MKTVSWPRTYKDDIIVENIKEYVDSKNSCCCCLFQTLKVTVDDLRPKTIYVDIIGQTKLKENLAYYSILNIVRGHGVFADGNVV
jgi:hypothetical protein